MTHISPAEGKKQLCEPVWESTTYIHLPGHASEMLFHRNTEQLTPQQESDSVVTVQWHLQPFTSVSCWGCPINCCCCGSGLSPYRQKSKYPLAGYVNHGQADKQAGKNLCLLLEIRQIFSFPTCELLNTSQLAHRWAWHISTTPKQKWKLTRKYIPRWVFLNHLRNNLDTVKVAQSAFG